MTSFFDRYTNIKHKQMHRRRIWKRILWIFSVITVFCTTYALILPAITWERSLICAIPEHKHDASCYETIVVPAGRHLVCTMQDHVHDDSCFVETRELICQSAEHIHTNDCFIESEELICQSAEHIHTDDCFNEAGELICQFAEHIHTDDCFIKTRELICQSAEHVHTDDCFIETRELICQSTEHVHTDDCYEVTEEHTETVLTCGFEEHEHEAACFDAPPAEDIEYLCGKVEHTHSAEQHCYYSDGSLRCTIPEHTHTFACKSNPNADLEDSETWEATFKDVELTGIWSHDILSIAKSQLGYTESTENYIVQGNEKTIKGYTRYGDWYGSPYSDWCAMFCSFCIDYAGVENYPLNANCVNWIKALSFDENEPDKQVYYHEAGTYEPKPGDLIFFDWDPYLTEEEAETYYEQNMPVNLPLEDERKADHVGFVQEIVFDQETNEPIQIVTIEGNVDDKVCEITYNWSDDHILGYGKIPENPEFMYERTIMSAPAIDGAVAVISGALPENAEAVIEAIPLTEEDLVDYFGENKVSAMKSFVAYDIRILADGEEWQPNDFVSIKVDHLDIDIPTDGLAVAHISSDNSVSTLFSQVDEDGGISFNTNGFSVYVFYQFTVDYYYEDMEYHQTGLSTVYLSELFEALGIERAVEDVANIKFTRPDLLQVEFTGSDWSLTSLQAFDSSEMLTVVFSDGSEINLNVFDAVSVKLQITDNYNLVTTSTDIELLLEEYNVRSTLGLPENTAVSSITVTPTNRLSTKTSNGKRYIVCNAEFTASATCRVVFDAKDNNNDDVACEFTNITADNGDRYTLWDYSGGKNGANSPMVVAGKFENVIDPSANNVVKDWTYPKSANDYGDIHTDNAPIGFAEAVFTTRPGNGWNPDGNKPYPIIIDGKTYYLYVSSSSVDTSYNGSSYRSGSTTGTGNIAMGRYSKQPCSLPCVEGNLLLVCWIENEAGEKVILPNVCVGNEGASNLWNWKFGGTGSKYIFTNDVNANGESRLKWNQDYRGNTVSNNAYRGTSVSATNVQLFQGILPDENGYYTIQLATQYTHRDSGSFGTPENVDELSVFRFQAYATVKKTVLDGNGNPVTGQEDSFDFGAEYTPQVSTTPGEIEDSFKLANGQTYNINGAINKIYSVWEVLDPDYITTIKINGTTVENPETKSITTESGETYQLIYAPDQYISTETSTIEFINQKKPVVPLTITKNVIGITTNQSFNFTATVTDGNFVEGTGYTFDGDEVNFQLGNNESITLNVTPGATITVTETGYNGYNVQFTDQTGSYDVTSKSFKMDVGRSITVNNTAGLPLPSTGGYGRYHLYILGAFLLGGALVYGIVKRRRHGKMS